MHNSLLNGYAESQIVHIFDSRKISLSIKLFLTQIGKYYGQLVKELGRFRVIQHVLYMLVTLTWSW